MQKLLNLIRSHLFIFAFFPLLWEVGHRGSCCDLCQSVFPIFSSRSFVVSGLTFRSLIHFEFIFVYGVRKCSSFILSDINHSRILYDPPPRILEIKANINKWDLIKIKSFCKTKETISKVNGNPQDSFLELKESLSLTGEK